MDNPSRSERTRNAAIKAALAIIARDGPGRLTLDAIVRESGVSKGGLMHQFPSKREVLKALLHHQVERFGGFSAKYLAEHGSKHAQPQLAAQIATLREVIAEPDPVAFALVGALGEDPSLLAEIKQGEARTLALLEAESPDPQLAVLRWIAARSLVHATLLGISPFSVAERDRLFDRLLDDRQWPSPARSRRPSPQPKRKRR